MIKAYNDLDEVLDKIFEEWEGISLIMLNNLIDAHYDRVREVYDLEGKFY